MATDQFGWRGRNDDGTEVTATFKANQGVAWIQQCDVNFRVRYGVQISGGASSGISNLNIQHQYSLNGTDWVDATGSSGYARASASPNVADNAGVLQRLTGATGTFIGLTGFDESSGNAGGANMDVVDDGNFEVEYCLQLRSAECANGQSIYLRCWNADASAAWTTYSSGNLILTAVKSDSKTPVVGALTLLPAINASVIQITVIQ